MLGTCCRGDSVGTDPLGWGQGCLGLFRRSPSTPRCPPRPPPLTLLRSPVPVAGAEAAAGPQPGSLLQRLPAQRQPDRQRRGRVPGEQRPLRRLPRAGGGLVGGCCPWCSWGGASGAAPGPREEGELPRHRLLSGTDGDKGVFSSNPFACPHLCPRGRLIPRGAVRWADPPHHLPPPRRAPCTRRWTPRAAPGTTGWWSGCSGTRAG